VDDIDVYRLPSEKQADFRREFLGFVFQNFYLLPYLTVLENVMLPLTGIKARRRQKEDLALKALAWVGLDDKPRRMPNQLSGGEQERVALARAIVNEPPILLADEPTGNLDSRNTRDVMHLLQQFNSDGMTILMVTHSNQCARYARRILQVKDGTLIDGDHRTAADNLRLLQAAGQ
jgi:putative ABC transport system ATP-binding protein